MSLRNTFAASLAPKAPELHVARPKECNSATRGEKTQLPLQPASNLTSARPGKAGATVRATPLQQASCTGLGREGASATPVAQLQSLAGATRNSPLTAKRATLALVTAIHRTCDARGDEAAEREGLISECSALPPEGQADMREHFEAEAQRWEFATGKQGGKQ